MVHCSSLVVDVFVFVVVVVVVVVVVIVVAISAPSEHTSLFIRSGVLPYLDEEYILVIFNSDEKYILLVI